MGIEAQPSVRILQSKELDPSSSGGEFWEGCDLPVTGRLNGGGSG
jgi:hypothetical protein